MNLAEPSQQAVIDFLANPATHGGAEVQRVDTHAATVFLAGPRAIKIKRAVKFPFLDFSTLEKRKAACEAEIEVNRAYAPAIYRGVVAITREADGALAIGGTGEAVEWAVEMARFDNSQTLDHLAEAGKIDGALADALGRVVARAHEIAPVVKDAGFSDALRTIAAQNEEDLVAAHELFPPPAANALVEATRLALDKTGALLVARERDGLVRRCHGDLHLGNIVLIDGAPVLFDALEFDPAFATIDLFYDLAFLLMDMIERGMQQQANIVFNRYLTQTRRDSDFDVLAALPLFLSVRAAIRAKVTGARHDKEPTVAQSARDYFALAGKLLSPPAPKLIAVGGLSGTGKSLLARSLAADIPPAPGAVWLRSDVERKALFGVSETDRLPEAAYTRDVTARVYASLAAKARRVLAAGHSAIVDAVYADAKERAEIEQAVGSTAFHGLFLTADLGVRIARVGSRTNDASDADAAVARAQERYDLSAIAWHKVDASGTPDETLRCTKELLA
ncbi:MAG TPA: AAA family ATPase [Pseudolabrys sp.]|nr:AAA family ATPase [Pseudolabrys sp.]